MGDFLPGFDVSGWIGVAVPTGTSSGIIERLNREINAGLASPRIATRIAELGVAPLAGSPADFGRLVNAEIEKSGKVIRSASIKPQ